MFTPLSVDVSGRLRASNVLALHFHTVFDLSGAKPVPWKVVNGDDKRRVRRPQGNYGTYLGPQPRYSRVGVYDAVVLESDDGNGLDEAVADASLNEGLTRGTVAVDAAGRSVLRSVQVRVRMRDAVGRVAGEATESATVMDGKFRVRVAAQVDKPQLWWPRGYGAQPLYKAEITLLAGGQAVEAARRTLGFRRITMPSLLHFEVNGVPVKLWGGDWVTPHWQTAVWDQPRVEQLFRMAEHANFNVFRVWAETESPRDAFYELADERGFLIWQDFTHLPLAPDEISRAMCREEATAFVKRLKHHPSILLWNGGNEAAMWHHASYNPEFKDRGVWPGLAAANEVGEICRRLDPARHYQPSSPYYGEDPNNPREGNTHGYTNIWFVPGYDYLNCAAEDTRIAAPVLHSLKRFMKPEHLWPAGYSTLYLPGDKMPFPRTWQGYTTGESWRKTGPVEQYYDAKDAAGLVHRLGMAESQYYVETVERQRRGREATEPADRRRCGGYLVWKFNDSWPHIYSGKVDYFLEPYHAYYGLGRAFAPVMLSFEMGTYIYLWAVNDTRESVSGTVRIQLFHLDRNQVTREIVREVTVAPGRSAVVVRLDEAGISAFRREQVLFATLTGADGKVIARSDAITDIERRVGFPEAKLDVQVKDGGLEIRADKFARTVTLAGDANGDEFGWFFEDNYFDLLPGEVKTVRILGKHAQGKITARPWYSPHASSVDWRR
jgi:beta-galactosidase/beta-glucuronidase